MSEPLPNEDIDTYLRQYRDKFTRDAMAARLMEAGHDPAVVEAALERLEAEHVQGVAANVSTADARVAADLRLTRIIVLVVYAGLSFVVLGALPAPTMFPPSRIAFIVLALVLGLLIAWIIGRTKSVAAMIAWSFVAVLFGLPIAFLGACVAGLRVG